MLNRFCGGAGTSISGVGACGWGQMSVATVWVAQLVSSGNRMLSLIVDAVCTFLRIGLLGRLCPLTELLSDLIRCSFELLESFVISLLLLHDPVTDQAPFP